MNGTANRLYFNERAGRWDEMVMHDPGRISLIMAAAGLRSGDTVLDIGSGTGVMIPRIREAIGASGVLVALDVAELMLECARRKFGDAADDFRAVDFHALDETERYDAIMAYSCFPHFGDRDGFFRKAGALLRPGGKLIIAHSESRETINARHHGDEVEKISLPLPPVGELAEQAMMYGFSVLAAHDSQMLYYLVAAERNADLSVASC